MVSTSTSTAKQIRPSDTTSAPLTGREASPGDILPWLPCTLALEVTVAGFTVGALLKLAEGTLVQTTCHQSTDIPLLVNGIQMAWTEFEVVGERLAARITDLT